MPGLGLRWRPFDGITVELKAESVFPAHTLVSPGESLVEFIIEDCAHQNRSQLKEQCGNGRPFR